MEALRRLCAVAALVGVTCGGLISTAGAQSSRDYNWTGLYLGGHVGGTESEVNVSFFRGFGAERVAHSGNGLTAGAHIGGLYQINALVIGAEVSWAALDHEARSDLPLNRSLTTQVDDLLLVTARFGFAIDRWLPYVKAGYATSEVSVQTFVTSTWVPATQSSEREHGYTLGMGVDYAVAPNILLGVQYDYVRLNMDARSQTVFAGFTSPQTVSEASSDIHSVTARLSFKFGGETVRYGSMK